MIPETNAFVEQNHWQKLLKQGFRDTHQLLDALNLSHLDEIHTQFPLRVPLGFVARMQQGDANDPLLLQVLPQARENTFSLGYQQDPVGDKSKSPMPGLIHKYHGRVLITVTGSCAINCRYCFRRHFPYSDHRPDWDKIIDYIKGDPSIKEIIFSGGDPLIAPDYYFEKIIKQLESIPHLTTLRIHSRLPIVLPERLCDDFFAWFAKPKLKPVLVIHCNHPNEINEHVKLFLLKAKNHHITLLNQSVLLKNVNDDANTLKTLSEKLFDSSVLPYYLHQLDKVQGAAHFAVNDNTAHEIIHQLRQHLPGYLVPKLVREIAGWEYKMPLAL